MIIYFLIYSLFSTKYVLIVGQLKDFQELEEGKEVVNAKPKPAYLKSPCFALPTQKLY